MPPHQRRNSVKDSVKRFLSAQTESLFPTGGLVYPPGGFPLPLVVRRKFSFAPQLPEISRLSLIQGFTASQYSLAQGTDLESSPARPRTLLTLESLAKAHAELPERRDSSSSRHIIRKVHGQKNLKDSVSHSVPSSDGYPAHSNELSTTDTTQRSLYSETDELKQHGHGQEGLYIKNQALKEHSLLFNPPIINHAKKIPDFLRSICITDPQLPGHQVTVMSHAMTPPETLENDEGLFLNLSRSNQATELISRQMEDGTVEYNLVLVGDLSCSETGQAQYKFVAQINITNLLVWNILDTFASKITPEDQEIDDDDEPFDWYDFACQEVDRAGQTHDCTSHAHQKPRNEALTEPSGSSSIAGLIEAIRPFYNDYFVLHPSPTATRNGAEPGYYQISYVSGSIFESGDFIAGRQFTRSPPETTDYIEQGLKKGTEFSIKIQWGEKGLGKWLYAIPMLGPGLGIRCWVCLLLDEVLPCFW